MRRWYAKPENREKKKAYEREARASRARVLRDQRDGEVVVVVDQSFKT